MKKFLLILLSCTLGVTIQASAQTSPSPTSADYWPNIIWIVVEDMSDHWSCYGEDVIQTPNIEQLAVEGELFEKAFVTSPVCSPSRSALITGMYQTTIDAHNHRSQIIRGKGGGNEAYYESFHLPEAIPFLPKRLREAGYYPVMGGESKGAPPGAKVPHKRGKTDYNFEWDKNLYDSYDWRDRSPGQPFFAQIQIMHFSSSINHQI